MRKDLTDITVVLDRSGSMDSCRKDMEGGLNQFVEDQKNAVGDARFTLVQFDTVYEIVHNGLPIKEVGKLKFEPRGGTALLDAVGRAINETGARLKALPESERPGLVTFLIITDGEENSSREFKLEKIKEMITHQQEKYDWKFSFLGANQDAFATGNSMGIAAGGISNYIPLRSINAFKNASDLLSSSRNSSIVGQAVNYAYTAEARADMDGTGAEKVKA